MEKGNYAKSTHICSQCENETDYPVIVDCEPKPEIWCLQCGISEGITFTLPESLEGSSDLDIARDFWGVSIENAYDRIEDDEDFRHQMGDKGIY